VPDWTIDIPDKKWFRPDEVAVLLNVSVRTVRYWYESGELPGAKLGERLIRFARPALIAFVERRAGK
jgi:excisionase family DNA binding protein